MQIKTTALPIFINSVAKHPEIKLEIIDIIKSGMTFSFRDNGISIANTDYHLSPTFFNMVGPKYWAVLFPTIKEHMSGVAAALGLTEWEISKYWYQEYCRGDYQPWHTHPKTMLTNVYYLSLPKGSVKTTLSIAGVESEFEVNEGDIITMPSYIKHCSNVHQGDESKIVVAFNAEVW
jgi:hypothetical protein